MRQDPPPTVLSDETVRLMGDEILGLPTSKEVRDGVRQVLDGLLAEIRQVRPEDRAGAEPMAVFTPGDWTP